MTPTVDTLIALYHSGAFLCLGIVAAYLLLRWGSTHWAWLEVPGRAHYISAVLAGLALLIVPASQGTTPNASMVVAAIGTVVALFLRGVDHPPDTSKSSQGGFARLGLVLTLAIGGIGVGCSWFQSKAPAVEAALINCAKADVGQTVVEVGLTLLADVATIIEGGADGWQAALDQLGAKYGSDAEACAVKAVATVLTSRPSSSEAANDPAAARAQAFVTTKGWRFK